MKIIVVITENFVAVGSNNTILFFQAVTNGLEISKNFDGSIYDIEPSSHILEIVRAAKAAAFNRACQAPPAFCEELITTQIKSESDFFAYMKKG